MLVDMVQLVDGWVSVTVPVIVPYLGSYHIHHDSRDGMDDEDGNGCCYLSKFPWMYH